MQSLKWTAQALADVGRLQRFLADKSPDAAAGAVQSIQAGVRILATQPRIGHPAEDMDPGFREWLILFGKSGILFFTALTGMRWSCLPYGMGERRGIGGRWFEGRQLLMCPQGIQIERLRKWK